MEGLASEVRKNGWLDEVQHFMFLLWLLKPYRSEKYLEVFTSHSESANINASLELRASEEERTRVDCVRFSTR